MTLPEMRISVDSLSEIRWARIERTLFQRLDNGEAPESSDRGPGVGWRPGFALIAASAAAAVIGGVLATELSRRTPVAETSSHIETRSSASHVVVGDATLDVAPESEVLVAGNAERGVSLVLDRGRVDCEVAPRHQRPPFIVEAGDVRVRVVGTRFGVTRSHDLVTVDVARGVVEVESHGEIQSVAAGQHWSSSDSVVALPAAAPRVAAQPPVVDAVPPSVESALPPAPVAAPLPPATSRQESPAKAHLHPPRGLHRSRAGAPVPAAAASDAVSPAASPARDSRQAQYEKAEGIEANDPEAAIAIYRHVAEGNDAWAEYSLYGAAHVATERGTGGEAEDLLEEYLRRFPRGTHAGEARQLLAQIHQALAH